MHAAVLSPQVAGTGDSRLHLPEVTLIAVSSIAIDQTLEALRISLQQVRFGAVLFLSHDEPPVGLHEEIEWRRIEPIRSTAAYSSFMLREIHHHVSTSHMLCVQWDGFILDSAAWTPEFLHFDYVGAPWPHFSDSMKVGNGGFSLRSVRLMKACAELVGDTEEAEDVVICRVLRPALERNLGIRFAPLGLAKKFAFERYPREGNEFGFHGTFNMIEVVGPRRVSRLMATLEPEAMTIKEHKELLCKALVGGRLLLALLVLRRIIKRV